jgi:hypothetical protein
MSSLLAGLSLVAHAEPYVLSTRVEALLTPVDTVTAGTCTPVLGSLFDGLEALDPQEAEAQDVLTTAAQVVARSWATRLQLHRALQTWHADGSLDADCMRALRRADLGLRYLEDYVLEALPATSRPPAWLADPAVPFTGRESLRSGDVLVTRANALSSAGISHMGRVDSQFSHNVLVYVDEQGRAWGVMAYLEVGALVEPIDEFLASGVDRVVVLRHPDQPTAAKAAKAAYERVAHGAPIDYDADFDHDDHTALFCSEVARWAYGELLGQPDTMPIDLAMTTFDQERNAAMFAAMGIEGNVTSAPSDMLYDPPFDLVAEWREVDDLALLRRYDAVVESAMTWMEERGYVLEAQRRHERFIAAALAVRRTPVVGQAIRKRIHPRGDLRFLVGALALQEAVTAVKDDLYAALGDRPEPLSYDELREALEQVRTADLARWEADPDSAHFTALLHPSER